MPEEFTIAQKIEIAARTATDAVNAVRACLGETTDPGLLVPDQSPFDAAKTDLLRQAIAWRFDNPNAPDSAEHERWSAWRIANGWTYGEARDDDAKTDPRLVPWVDLDAAQRLKSILIRTIAKAVSDTL